VLDGVRGDTGILGTCQVDGYRGFLSKGFKED
jgi:hypothetical protein